MKIKLKNIAVKKMILAVLFVAVVFLFLGVIFSEPVSAQTTANQLLWGGKQGTIGSIIGLADSDPRIIAAKIIRVFIGFLGIIALGLIIYGGWLWMTSGGDEQKIDKAKQVLKNAAIGLIIILASFGIVTFILNKLFEAIGGTGSPTEPGGSGAGLGALGSCTVETVYPQPGQREVPRNTVVIITFKEEVKSETVCTDTNSDGFCNNKEKIIPDNIRFFKSNDNDSCEAPNKNCATSNVIGASVITTDNKTFVFMFDQNLGSPSEYIWYTARFTNKILKKSDNSGIFSTCRDKYMKWQFEVSNKIDLTPPQVQNNGVFPYPDFKKDEPIGAAATPAKGDVTVENQPAAYKAATAGAVTPNGGSPAVTATINTGNKETGTLVVTILSGGNTTATLKKGSIMLGSQPVNNNSVNFPEYFSLKFSASIIAGNSWNVPVTAEEQADTLTIGNKIYTFVSGAPSGDQIQIGADKTATANNIQIVLAGHPDVTAVVAAGDKVNITAKVAGKIGNSIAIVSNSESEAPKRISTTKMSGGTDNDDNVRVYIKRDQPRNSAIQINFNEAILPTTVSGDAGSVRPYIRVVNNKIGAVGNGLGCVNNNGCQSFKCTAGLCDKDFLAGKFIVSNVYHTVEFLSDEICGMNGCGENIYCLPPDSDIRVEFNAANFTDCGADSCASRVPYSTCVGGACEDSNHNKFPLSKSNPFDGVMDAALNSLDGDRSGYAEGPVTYYNETDTIAGCIGLIGPNEANNGKICTFENQLSVCGAADSCKYPDNTLVIKKEDRIKNLQTVLGDNYKWSFYISDKIEIGAPVITDVTPNQGGNPLTLDAPVEITFNKLMMSSSLITGERKIIDALDKETIHKHINIWNFNNSGIGYWITKTDLDKNLDSDPEITRADIQHSMFSDATSYRAQSGSGLKDIYQNCFKPSSGPGCTANDTNPSCCPTGINPQVVDSGKNCP